MRNARSVLLRHGLVCGARLSPNPTCTYATGTGNDGRKQLQGFSHTHVVTGIERQIAVEKKLVFASAVDETDEEARVAYAVTE
jgi:hypothetical protein